jgi:UDP-N-acetyl-2-amino-2-deoxyglucuronate dehydrogenase
MRAIKAIGGNLSAACDPVDCTPGVSGSFPDARCFAEFNHFDRHVGALKRRGKKIDYVSICSPSHLHDVHCHYALRSDAHAICEKPIALNPSILDTLEKIEANSTRRIFTIQQLRFHPAIEALKSKVKASSKSTFSVSVTYVTARDASYHASWKGDQAKSGGIVTNIGVHFIDAFVHIFGPASSSIAHVRDQHRAAGCLFCGRAVIRWFLSVHGEDLPASAAGTSTYRSLTLDGEEIDLADGMADLHTRSYQDIVAGRGVDLHTVRPPIEIVSAFRTAPIELRRGERHPFVQKYLT